MGKLHEARFCLFGASPLTGNLGVTALCYSVLGAVAGRMPGAAVTVFDDGWGTRSGVLEHNGRAFPYARCGARLSRRYHRPECLWTMRVCGWLGGLGNPGVRAVAGSAAALDVSGGDSFTDLYGPKRFEAVSLTKLISLEQGVPLVLLPQTYGPFNDPRRRRIAIDIIRRATTAWARDEDSFEQLQRLLGTDFDPRRHCCGVDMAFALPRRAPAESAAGEAGAWLADGRGPVVGINVSGLLYNDPEAAVRQYGLKADYRQVVLRLSQRLLRETEARVVLVPHVVTPPGHYESDSGACESAARELADEAKGRVAVLPALDDPREIKGVIAKFEWFCGMRMHSTIAALSSGVATAAVAYSLKTKGVFESCGQGEQVVDPRTMDTTQVVERLWDSWKGRAAARASLRERIPQVIARAESQMDRILGEAAEAGSRRVA